MLHSERGQKVHPNYVNGFHKKILAWEKEAIMGPKMTPTSESALRRLSST